MDTFCTYEQHFGLSGHPFSATSDPDFYFESRGHRHAYAHLRHAVLAGECFMVVTGDAGAGKTMLVRNLLRGLETDGIVTALLSGAVLDARGLLLAILSSFRTQVSGESLDELRAGLHACLTALDSIGRRALVVVDEAQHLQPDAIDELIGFATPQWADDVPIQVLLVGQPMLRMSLPNMAQITRRPNFLFCDIGLLSRPETRAYIEHRLRHVRWDRSPSFSDDAHDRIYWATGGVPQQVNRLCHRLLTVASRQQRSSISPELVDGANAELRDEKDETAPAVGVAAAVQPAEPVPSASYAQGPGASATVAVDDSPAEDVLRLPTFRPDAWGSGLLPKIRNAFLGYGWLVLPVLVVAGFVGSPAETSVLSSMLAVPPRTKADSSPGNGGNAARITRIGEPAELARTSAGQPAGRQAWIASLMSPFPHHAFIGAQRDDERATRAQNEAPPESRRERTVPVVAKSESPRVATAATKGATSRTPRAASKPNKAPDTQRSAPRQLASRSRGP